MGAMVPPSRKSCYNFRVVSIDRVVDGDTIDVSIDLCFDLIKKERVRIAGIDTPEKRTRDLEGVSIPAIRTLSFFIRSKHKSIETSMVSPSTTLSTDTTRKLQQLFRLGGTIAPIFLLPKII
jgi:hypothetical protein